ncbi:hypothetical protein J6590_018846 [Homalodisca vitripennis]|nr:hypothetical protein J6590_018846 [Homalodisca vitripennis]
MDLQDCNTKVTQKRSITEDSNVKRKKKLKANPSTKKLIERCTREKNDLTDSFKMYSQTFQEFARKYHLVQENFLKYDKSYTALVAGVRKGFPELLDTQLNDEPLQNTKEIGREMDCETVTNQTKPLANMEIVFEMMILKETATSLFDMYDVLQKEADLKKAFLKQLVEQEELYKKHFEVFKRNMMNPIAVGNNHSRGLPLRAHVLSNLMFGLRVRAHDAQIEHVLDELGAYDDSDVDEVEESEHNTDSELSDNENVVEYDPVPPGIRILPDFPPAQEMDIAEDTVETSQHKLENDLDDFPLAFRILPDLPDAQDVDTNAAEPPQQGINQQQQRELVYVNSNELYIAKNGTMWRHTQTRARRCDLLRHLPGVKNEAKNADSPLKALKLFFPDEILEEIVQFTNIYIETKRDR